MPHVTISGSRSPLREADIHELEQILSITLPSDYRTFLLQHNGGRPQPSVFPIANCPVSNQGILTWLLSIRDGEDTILAYIDTYKDRMPPHLLPIGCDPGSNVICISVSGTDRGSVYFWAHDFEALPDEIPSYANVYVIADSFDHLLERLGDLLD